MIIKVGMHGCAEQESRSLQIAFKHRAANIVTIGDCESADVYLVDVKGAGGVKEVAGLPYCNDRMIVIVDRETSDFAHQIVRPLSFTKLMNIIKDVSGTSVVGADELSPTSVKPIFKEHEELIISGFLVGTLHKIVSEYKKGQIKSPVLRFQITSSRWLLLDFKRYAVFGNLSMRSLLQLSKIKNYKPIQVSESAELTTIAPDDYKIANDIETLLWQMVEVLAADRGLVKGVDPQTAYKLIDWPNLPKLGVSDELYPVVSYWASSPVSIDQLQECFPDLDSKIILLANQCFVCGLLTVVERSSRVRRKAVSKDGYLGGVFKMIIKKVTLQAV